MKTKLKGKVLAIMMSLAMAFTMMLMIGGTAYADEVIIDKGSCGENLGWTYYSSGELKITGSGTTMDDYSVNPQPWWDYRNDITKITLPTSAPKLQHIGDFAFDGMVNVSSVTLSSSLESIGVWAFRFADNLTSITIPSNVKSLGRGAFGTTGLRSVEFASGSKLKTIDVSAFTGCYLSNIDIPNGVETIGYYAFGECQELKTITIPASVTSIGNEVFAHCDKLETINYLGSKSQWQTLTNGVDLKAPAGVEVLFPNYTKKVEFYPSGDDYFATFTYDGKEHTCDVDEGMEYTWTGTTKATNAGIYTVTATLKTDSDYVYEWTDGTTDPKTIEWKINKATVKVNVPEGKELPYNGEEQTGVVEGTGYTLSGDTKATVVGTYTPEATLVTDDPNYTYKWENGTTDPKTITWKIYKARVYVTAPEGKNLIYNGEEQTGVEEGEDYTLRGTTKATNAGGPYSAYAALKFDSNIQYMWADGITARERIIEWNIYKATAKVNVPEGKDLTYNGEEQTGVVEGTGYTLSGDTKATVAGTYTAKATLVTNDRNYTYKWENGTTDPKTIEWKINKATAKVTPPATKTFTYNGKEQVYAMDGANYTLSGTTKATKAGTYTAKATLNTDDNYIYKWSDGTTAAKSITWKINKATAKVTVPKGKTFTYNGKTKTGVAAGANYTLSGTVKATKAGTFTAKATLKTNANYIYKWADGTSAAKSIKWKINKAANPLSVKAKTATVKYTAVKKKDQVVGVTKVIAFTKKGQGKMTYTKASGNKNITIAKTTGKVTVKKGLKKGTYSVKVKVKAAGNANYKASAVKTVTFKVVVK